MNASSSVVSFHSESSNSESSQLISFSGHSGLAVSASSNSVNSTYSSNIFSGQGSALLSAEQAIGAPGGSYIPPSRVKDLLRMAATTATRVQFLEMVR